jgi:hypothetical protein
VRVRLVRFLPGLALLAAAGCGRFGFEYAERDAAHQDAPVDDAALEDAAPPDPEPDAAEDAGDGAAEDAGDGAAEDAGDGAAEDAGDMDAAELDAAEPEAGPLDASQPEAAAPEAGLPEASTADCRLSVGGAPVGYASGEAAALQGTYIFSLEQTGMCAGPSGCSAQLGAQVVQTACDLSACQMWESVDIGDAGFALRNVANGACLYMTDGTDGTRAVVWECSSTNTERWQAVCASNDKWRLVSLLSGKPLQGAGASTPGTAIEQTSVADSAQQRWTLQESAMPLSVVLPTSESSPGQLWRYTTSTPPGTWMQQTFDDSAWMTGRGGFGDVDRGFTSVRTSWTSADLWLRQSFQLDSLPSSLSVRIYHDEDVQVYINGVLAFSEVSWSQGYRTVKVADAALAALQLGANRIAVHCHNVSAPQFLDVGLAIVSWQ